VLLKLKFRETVASADENKPPIDEVE